MLWIELAEEIDALRLNERLAYQGYEFAVGNIFSAAGKYRNCIRINYALLQGNALESAMKALGHELKDAPIE
ncbi:MULTISPECIES: hypothetical protein [Pseudomonas]|uniref:hypothetical protein n=1 Tax=Pseudomonas TaxID=286 RepID=UPI001E3ACC08|nr:MULTISPECIES: hypothetical protein [Pseudomonas]